MEGGGEYQREERKKTKKRDRGKQGGQNPYRLSTKKRGGLVQALWLNAKFKKFKN